MVILNVPRIEQKVRKSSGTCGPTSIQQILRYYGIEISLKEIMDGMILFDKGGTSSDGAIGDYLLKQGFSVKIYTIDTKTFDPSWFKLSKKELLKKLKKSYKISKGFKKYSYKGFISFLKHGGKIEFKAITLKEIKDYLKRIYPIMAGVDDSLLYGLKRSRKTFYDDDMRGKVWGHELVIAGYKKDKLFVVDPFPMNTFSRNGKYFVYAEKLLANIHSQGGYVIVPRK
jgi:hypothetical protein